MVKRMRLIDDHGTVYLSYHDRLTDADLRRSFWCPEEGGYVVDLELALSPLMNHALPSHVCEWLNTYGDVLVATPATLADVVRREYRRMRRQEKRAYT